MLDNLKLGYGGTKEEMQRLLSDANKLNKQQGIITDYSIDSFADITEAIQVVQDNLGITGTTALEAASTLSGSFGTMQAAWTNFIAKLSVGNRDQVNQAMMDLASSASTFFVSESYSGDWKNYHTASIVQSEHLSQLQFHY